MSLFKAPEDCLGISVGGEHFQVVDGYIETPNEGDYSSLASHGFVAVSKRNQGAAADPAKTEGKGKGKAAVVDAAQPAAETPAADAGAADAPADPADAGETPPAEATDQGAAADPAKTEA